MEDDVLIIDSFSEEFLLLSDLRDRRLSREEANSCDTEDVTRSSSFAGEPFLSFMKDVDSFFAFLFPRMKFPFDKFNSLCNSLFFSPFPESGLLSLGDRNDGMILIQLAISFFFDHLT